MKPGKFLNPVVAEYLSGYCASSHGFHRKQIIQVVAKHDET